MLFSEAIELIKDKNFIHVRIFDNDNKRLIDIEGSTADSIIQQLEKYKNQLASYGIVKMHLATESVKRGNWKDCYIWKITFTGEASNVHGNNLNPGLGYVSANEAALLAKVEKMEAKQEWDKQFNELREELKAKDEFSKYLPMLPLLGLFMDIPAEKMQSMASLYQISGAMTQKPGIAGLIKEDPKAKVIGTEEEQKLIKSINDNLETLSHKVPVQKIEEFIRTLNDKPEFLNTLITMSQQFKTS